MWQMYHRVIHLRDRDADAIANSVEPDLGLPYLPRIECQKFITVDMALSFLSQGFWIQK